MHQNQDNKFQIKILTFLWNLIYLESLIWLENLVCLENLKQKFQGLQIKFQIVTCLNNSFIIFYKLC